MFNVILWPLFISLSFAQFTHESELATVATGGNQEVSTYLGKTSNQYTLEKNVFKSGGHYTYGETASEVTARDWHIDGRYEREASPRVALTLGELIEGYKFQGIKARYNSDLGVKYSFIKEDLRNFFAELGYRYSIEDRYQPVENVYENKARIYSEFNKKVSETFQYKFWLEYIPNFTDTKDYLVNFEASATAILTSRFSLKVAYKGMYDQVPAIVGNKNYDYLYTTSLVAKF